MHLRESIFSDFLRGTRPESPRSYCSLWWFTPLPHIPETLLCPPFLEYLDETLKATRKL